MEWIKSANFVVPQFAFLPVGCTQTYIKLFTRIDIITWYHHTVIFVYRYDKKVRINASWRYFLENKILGQKSEVKD